MQADFSTLKKRVVEVMRKSLVGERVRDVLLEADRDDEGTDFLRITLEVRPLDGVSDADIEALVESIEKTVGDVDERFPSVRFADAA
jgi:hypothetical protein